MRLDDEAASTQARDRGIIDRRAGLPAQIVPDRLGGPDQRAVGVIERQPGLIVDLNEAVELG
ncbi:MAG: hypothetical protein E6J90_05160 [Deltaproteobacteria bacterium]|nr:MAG: hypothetical protein E6J90_05160 [Deltaproteobacteria bacterium]